MPKAGARWKHNFNDKGEILNYNNGVAALLHLPCANGAISGRET